MTKRSQFEQVSTGKTTTIAPNPADGKCLTEHGWRYVTRDMDGNEIESRNADKVRKQIWKSFGHKVS